MIKIQVLDGIKNPASSYADAFSVEIYDSSNQLKDYNQYLTVNITPGVLKNVQLTTSSQVSGATSDLTITFTPGITILQNSTIKINVPCFNENSGSSSCISMILSGTVKTSLKINSGIYSSSIMTNSNSELILSNIFPNNNSDTTTQISFTIQNILNPSSTAPQSGYIISTAKDDKSIEESAQLSLQVTLPSTVSSFNIAILTTTVNQMTQLSFLFMTPQYKPNNAKLELIFPDDLPISQISLKAINGISNITPVVNYSIDGQKVMMTNAISNYYSQSITHFLIISNINNPSSTKPTGRFKFNIYTPDNYIMYSLNFSATLQATPGQFRNIIITQTNKEVNVKNEYTFSFINSNPILADSYLKIIFPIEIKIENSAISNCTGILSGLDSNAQCEITQNSILIVTNGFTNRLAADSLISFRLNNVINNSSVKSSESFSIASYTKENYSIDLNTTGITVDFIEGAIIDSQIVSQSLTNYETTQYSVSFKNKNKLDINSMIIITFPNDNEVVITDSNLIQNNCVVNIGEDIFNSNVCFVENNRITIKKFNISKIISSNTNITINLLGIKNPRSFKLTNSFNIITQTETGYNIDKNYNSLTIKNSIIANTQSVIITPSSYITGGTVFYEINIIPKTKLINGDILILIIPISIGINSGNNISIKGISNLTENLTNTITKNNSGNYTIKLTLNFNTQCGCVTSSDSFIFQIQNLKNPVSIKPSENFEVQFMTSDSYDIEKYNNPLIITMITPNQLQETYTRAVNNQKNSVSDYNIQMMPYNRIPKGGLIIIKYPNQIKVIDGGCIPVVGLPNQIICTHDSENKEIILINAFVNEDFSPSLIQFTIKGLKNEMTEELNQTDSFQFFTTTQDEYKIDQKINGLNITFNCQSPCSSCLGDQKTCLSCIENGQFTYLHEGKCLAQCPSGYSSNGTKTNCFQCNSLCQTCLDEDKDKCLNCIDKNQFYVSSLLKCVNVCPDKFYPDNTRRCLPCQTPCDKCSSFNKCITCQTESSFNIIYPSLNRCVASCPQGITVHSLINNSCIECDSSCLNCESDIKNCTSCKDDKVLYQNKCIDPNTCPLDFYPDLIIKKCVKCNPNCLQCGGDSYDSCKICKDGFIMNNLNQCVLPKSQCQLGYFLDTTTLLCEKCKDPCLTCQFNQDFCQKCIQGLFLQNNKCVEKCYDGFYLQNNSNDNNLNEVNLNETSYSYECKPCDNSCKTCGGNNSICTSCNILSFLFDYKCLSKCPDGYFQDDLNKCSKCLLPSCELCEDKKCLKCNQNFFLYNNGCLYNCPKGYKNDINSMNCIKIEKSKFSMKFNQKYKFSSTYFIFLFSALWIIILITIVKYKYDESYFCAACISIIAIINILHNLIYIYFAYVSGYELFFLGLSYCIFMKVLLNSIFIITYDFYTNKDSEFIYWKSTRKNISAVFFFFAYVVDYKIMRLFYSRFLKCSLLNPKFDNYNKIHSPYRYVLIGEITFLTIPLTIFSILILVTSKPQCDLWWAALENLLVSFILFVIELIDFNINKDLNLDFYNQKKMNTDILPYNSKNKKRGSFIIDKRFDFKESIQDRKIQFSSIINSKKKKKMRSAGGSNNKIERKDKLKNKIRSKSLDLIDKNKNNSLKIDLICLENLKYKDDTNLAIQYNNEDINIKENKDIMSNINTNNKKNLNIIERLSSGIKNLFHNLSKRSKDQDYLEIENEIEKSVGIINQFEPGVNCNTPSFNGLDKTERSNLPFKNYY